MGEGGGWEAPTPWGPEEPAVCERLRAKCPQRHLAGVFQHPEVLSHQHSTFEKLSPCRPSHRGLRTLVPRWRPLRCMTVTSGCKTDSGDLPRCDGKTLARDVSWRGRSMCPRVRLRGFSLLLISHGLWEWTLATYACCSDGNDHPPPSPRNSWSTSVPP